VYDDVSFDPFRMSNVVKCINESDIKDLSSQLRVQVATENITVMLFNILNDKPAKFSKWRECKFSTPAEFKNQLYNFDMGSLSVETLLMVKENTEMDWFSYDECSNYYTLCGFFVMWI